MPEMSDRTASRLEPVTGWTIVTEAPLKGLAFAREAGRILAWDEGNQLYLLSAQGESLSFSRVPQRITAGAISDEGSLIALLGDGDDAGLLLLNADFDVEVERPAPTRVVVPDDRSARAVCGDRQPAGCRELPQPLRPGGRAAGDDPAGARTSASWRTGPSWWELRRSACWSGSRSWPRGRRAGWSRRSSGRTA